MKSSRTYKQGRSIAGWQKRECVTSYEQVKAGDILIKDSHWFRATNLVRVQAVVTSPHLGFVYNFAGTDGRAFNAPVMMCFDYELRTEYDSFHKAEKRRTAKV